MAEENEVVVPPKEELLGGSQEEASVVDTPSVSPEEELAAESGWVPKDQWKGDPDSWRPAKEFNERGELFTRIKQQSKDIHELRNAMTFLTTQQKKQYLAGFQNAIAQLTAKRNSALEEGDVLEAQKLTDSIAEHKEVLKAQKQEVAQPTAPQPTTTFFAWADKNQWYTKDRKMTHYADAVGLEFKEENPTATEADMLRHVSKEVKERFAEKFQQVKSPPSPDGDGRGGNRPSAKAGYSSAESAMPAQDREIMRTILKTTGMSKEEYLKQYSS